MSELSLKHQLWMQKWLCCDRDLHKHAKQLLPLLQQQWSNHAGPTTVRRHCHWQMADGPQVSCPSIVALGSQGLTTVAPCKVQIVSAPIYASQHVLHSLRPISVFTHRQTHIMPLNPASVPLLGVVLLLLVSRHQGGLQQCLGGSVTAARGQWQQQQVGGCRSGLAHISQ